MGATRAVFLIDKWAIKVPNFYYGWRPFLWGLLANIQEKEFSRMKLAELCPVVFSLPGGFLSEERLKKVNKLKGEE